MKRRYFAVMVMFILRVPFTGAVFSETADYKSGRREIAASSSSQTYAEKKQKCFLWKVESKSGTVYLLGSIHVAKEGLYPLNEKIERAFNNSEALAVEVNINDEEILNNQLSIMKKAVYPDNETLKQNLSSQTYELLKVKLKQFSLPIEALEQYKPWYLATILEGLELQKLGYDANYGIDIHFLRRAQGVKEVLELESWDYQINLFDSFSKQEQELFLSYTLKDMDELEKTVDEVLDLWLKGDAKTMETLLFEQGVDEQELASLFEKLFYERNRKMCVKIEEFLKTYKDYFVIVGAGHLVGKQGMIELLKEKGYFVEQL